MAKFGGQTNSTYFFGKAIESSNNMTWYAKYYSNFTIAYMKSIQLTPTIKGYELSNSEEDIYLLTATPITIIKIYALTGIVLNVYQSTYGGNPKSMIYLDR